MSRSKKNVSDALVLVLDVGKSVSERKEGEKRSFLEESKECLSWIIQRRLIAESTDFISILLLGTDETKNDLAESGYKHITCKFQHRFANFEMLKFIETEIKGTTRQTDWIAGLIVSMDLIKSQEELYALNKKQIVLFSDFMNPNVEGIEIIVQNVKDMDIQVTIIGPNNISALPVTRRDDEPPLKKKCVNEGINVEHSIGEKILSDLCKKLGTTYLQIITPSVALRQLANLPGKQTKPAAWNSILDIGAMGILISMYKKTDILKSIPLKNYLKSEKGHDPDQPTTSASTPSETKADFVPVARDTVMHYKHVDETTKEIEEVSVQRDEVIRGHRYGTTIVPFSDEDKQILDYKPGSKSLSVIGFTKISRVPQYLFSEDFSYVVTPRNNDEHAEVALSALVQAMKVRDLVAVARKVYADNKGLRLGVLYPLVEEIDDANDEVVYKECLVFLPIAYGEEVLPVNFPSLEPLSKTISDGQIQVVDKLIEKMDLMNANIGTDGEPCEAFDVPQLYDFKNQFQQYCTLQRGLFPDRKLPKDLPPFIAENLELPQSLVGTMKALETELKQNFAVRVKKSSGFSKSSSKGIVSSKIGNDQDESGDAANGTSVSESTEEMNEVNFSIDSNEGNETKNLKKLFNRTSLPDMCGLENLMEGLEGDTTAFVDCFCSCLSQVRQIHVNGKSEAFNFWIRKLKAFLLERGSICSKVWNAICRGQLGLITDKENRSSLASEEEGCHFLELGLTQSLPCHTPVQERSAFPTVPDSISLDPSTKDALDMLF